MQYCMQKRELGMCSSSLGIVALLTDLGTCCAFDKSCAFDKNVAVPIPICQHTSKHCIALRSAAKVLY